MPGLFDRFASAVSSAYQALRGGAAQRMPDGAIVVDPLAAWRWTVTYTPERLEQIKARRNLAEVVQLIDDILTDDRVRAVAFGRAEALAGCEVEFVTGGGRKKRSALKAADPERDLWLMLPEAEWLQMHVWGLGINFGTGRKRWWERASVGSQKFIPRRRNGRVVPLGEFWHPRSFRLDPGSNQWIAKVDTVDAMGSLLPVDRPMAFGDGEFVCFCPWGGAGDTSRGLWLPASKLWLLKQHVIRSGASLGQRMSTPIKVIEYALGQQGIPTAALGGTDAERKQLVDEIFALQRQGVVSLPPGFTMKLLSMPATSWEMLGAQWAACDDAQGILWQGNNLVSSIKGGSFAAANTGDMQLVRKLRLDAQSESTFVHDEFLCDWAEVNFGDREAAPWPSRNVEPPEDLKSKALTWLSVMQAVTTGEKQGWIFEKKKVGEVFEMPFVEGQENSKPPPPPAPPPAPGVLVPNAPAQVPRAA